MVYVRAVVVSVVVFVSQWAVGDVAPFAEPEKLTPGEDFLEILAKVAPTVYMSGQPTAEGLARMKALGVTRIINLRTQAEMDNRKVVTFDEAAVAADLGLDYVHIPSGGPDSPYARRSVEAFATAIDGAGGNVLLHCTVAYRATHLWTAYLIDHLGMPAPQAVAIARQLNLGLSPLEGFLGRDLLIGVEADE